MTKLYGLSYFPASRRLCLGWRAMCIRTVAVSVMLCVLSCRKDAPTAGANAHASSQATTQVSTAPTRIIAFAPSSVELITALGQADRLVGIGDFCADVAGMQTLPRVGGLFNPDLESILRLKPDLVIVRGNNEDVIRLCRENAIPLYHDPVERLADVFIALEELGDLLHAEATAASLCHSLHKRLDEIKQATSNLPRPRVLFTISRRPDSLEGIITPGRGTFVTSMIELAGAENVFGHVDAPYPDVSPESILATQPEVIVEAMPEVDMTPELEQQIHEQWAALGPMPATRDGRIIILTDDNVLIPSPRLVETVAKMATLLHPEVQLD